MDSTPPPAAPPPGDDEHARGWTPYPLPEPAVVDMTGVVLADRFELGERIGSGGMSAVFLARDRALQGLAAVKILASEDADARRRFVAEARLLANLRHPHLVQVLAVGETEAGAPYMVLEYLPGKSLHERLAERGPLPWREVVEIASQVAGALATIHRASVVHRDVKPGNIVLIESLSGRPLVKLIDLGVAKVHDWADVQAGAFTPAPRHQTDLCMLVGTPGFYPPEAGHVAADPRFDIYALGVTIFKLCTGKMPKPIAYSRMGDEWPGCMAPPDLEALVESALAREPEARLASAEAFQRQLEAIRTAHAEEDDAGLFDGVFELLDVLGVGAKAEVYRAYHRDAAMYVALKLPSAASRSSIEERLRFAREARILAAVRHPALSRFIHCKSGARQRQPYIVMELVKGRRAGEFCLAETRLGAADVLAVGKQIAGALIALHDRGILHRDVSTSNVLIDLGRETRATLIDVGMADLTDRFYVVVDQRYPTPPESRVRLGSGGIERLEWTAPEARGGAGWTEKSDVYSLGLLLYKILTGKRPFDPGSTEVTPPSAWVRGCPRALEWALEWALEQDPAKRCDARALLVRLEEAELEMQADAEGEEVDGEAEAVSERAAARVPESRSRPARWRRAGGIAGLVVLWALAFWSGRATAPGASGAAEVATSVEALHDRRSPVVDAEDGLARPEARTLEGEDPVITSETEGKTTPAASGAVDAQEPRVRTPSPPAILRRWAREHDEAIQRCLASMPEARKVEITVLFDDAGEAQGVEGPPSMPALVKRCLQRDLVEGRVRAPKATPRISLTLVRRPGGTSG